MPTPVIPIAAGGVALLGAGALVVALLVPGALPPTARVWVDGPTAGQLVLSEDVPIVLHGTGEHYVGQLRVQIAQAGSDVASVSGSQLSGSSPRGVLATDTLIWEDPDPGDYVITPYSLSDGQWVVGDPVPVTVVETPGIPVDEQPDPSPTATPTPTPTPTASVEPVAPPEPTSAPPTSAPPGPTPTPTAAPVAPSGTITRSGPPEGAPSEFIVIYKPSAAFVDIQFQPVNPNTPRNNSGPWTSYGCSTGVPTSGGNTRCSVLIPEYGGGSGGKWVWVRATISANGETTTVYLQQPWVIPLTIG